MAFVAKAFRTARCLTCSLPCTCLLQGEQFKILHTLLVNGDTRETALNFVYAAIDRNVKRSQLQVSTFWNLYWLNDFNSFHVTVYGLLKSGFRYCTGFAFALTYSFQKEKPLAYLILQKPLEVRFLISIWWFIVVINLANNIK